MLVVRIVTTGKQGKRKSLYCSSPNVGNNF